MLWKLIELNVCTSCWLKIGKLYDYKFRTRTLILVQIARKKFYNKFSAELCGILTFHVIKKYVWTFQEYSVSHINFSQNGFKV